MPINSVKHGALEYLAAQGIRVPHCFTTRYGGVSRAHLSGMNLANHRGDDPENVTRNFEILGDALGFDTKHVVLTRQVHSDIVRKVGLSDCGGLDHHAYPECDALITREPGVVLVVFTADCTPILLHDPVTGAVGAAHAGWRGTAAGIAGKTAQAMVREYGCDPANIRAAIGPNLSMCCFETDADVPDAMIAALGDEARPFIEVRGQKFHVDLKAINALWLKKAGGRHIEISGECTMCQPDRFWSHRVTRGIRGSQGAIIVCKEGAL